ncbi:hypothetical protein I350_04716 [Cryptococcus amylolentus CBS 6273]|uniref:1-phosphatidylinositol-3-phosphate 5-kinase n=1 Tax=Cryptococcus amylolentus CBS 6273 TaxID=1296118 RepID=A0A1E3JZM0_9TREE|nr:hypothetical protein I350_04716 [Cryptococcus amylolentus CBS 6273]
MAHPPSVASSHRNSAHGLTTFPNPFQDEPEQGILPSFLSKVKQTFTSGSSTAAIISQQAKPDKGGSDSNVGNYAYEEDYSKIQPPREGGQTEAQAIAEAVMRNRAQMATAAAHAASVQQGRVSTAAVPIIVQPGADPPGSAPMQPAHSTSPLATLSMKPPPSTVISAGSTSTQPTGATPSVASSHNSTAPTKRSLAPSERQWRPSGVAPAQVTISPVTTTVQTASKEPPSSPGPRSVPFPISKPSHRTHIHLSNPAGPSSSRSATPLHHHAHSNSLGMATGKRARRSSIATLPDSPSSLSISGMIAANAELQSHYVPGFPISQDDTRSVRSLGAVKRLNGMSRIVRRMKGEGLSKQYWMADEHCKECYDCKSLFTAWRRKHHCRICGQIFCSRCASNIINARRFGKEGVLRVCNLCLKIMEEYKEDDEDDRRSINSVSTSVHRYPSITDRAFLDAAISPELQYAKSPFAASQLFASHPNDSLTAIDESSVSGPFSRWGNELSHEEDIEFQRSFSPNDGSDGEGGQMWIGKAPKTAAPFRRPMEMDQKIQPESESPDPENETPGTPSTAPPSVPILGGAHRNVSLPRLEFPRTYTMSTDGDEGRSPLERSESSHQLIGLRTRASQAGLTALLDGERTEGLWRARSHSFAKQPEMLSGASLHHFQLMLAQSISRADLPRPEEWHRVLSSLILKVPNNLQPNVRAGDDIDVRSYIKIKKVPGGKISDSEYVDGIVITKNVAHKTMSRRLYNPRIMVVTFPLDYHRVDNQFMSLDPILAQEKDYLRLLTKRIIDAKPHIVLAQSSVSRIALDYLLESDIALARNVKSSAVHQVARCTGADIVASMDRLVLQPRMGRCGELQIQSFDHELIPGRRKTLMRFEGANREQGCTIILRGADLETLRKVKVITDFMSLVAYHLKTEMILYNDEHNIVPPEPPLPAEYRELLNMLEPRPSAASSRAESVTSETSSNRDPPATPTPHSVNVDTPDPESPTTPKPNSTFTTNTAASSIHDSDDDERENEKREALEVTRQIATSLQPYLNTVLSSSAAIRFPPPAILAKMAELDRRLAELRQSRDEAEAAQILEEETKIMEPPKTSLHPVAVPDGGDTASIHTIASTATGNTAATATEPSAELSSSAAMSALPTSTFSTVTHKGKDIDRDPYRVLRKPDEVSKESALAQVQHAHKEHLKLWQWHIRRFAPEQLRPENYQGIVFLSSLGCEGSDKPCVEPALKHIDFYQAGDQTVGQFMETLTATALEPCPSKTCERLLLFHFQLLVHGERRLQIVLDQFPCPSPGHEDQIITWSYCRQCTTPSPTTILREETWKMSWGAYLEHCFYPPKTPAGFSCPHDAHRDQIRYFAHRNLAVRIHNEQIDIFEPVRPSISLQVKAETKVALKNREYEAALAKNGAFFDSVVTRLKTIDVNVVQSDKVSLLEKTIDHMLARVASDKEEMVDLLNRTYKLTPMTDVLSLTTVFRSLQDKVVQWDMDFGDIEKAFIPTEKDLKKMTATHLKRLFANQDAYSTLERGAGPPLAEADEENAGEKEATIDLESSDYTPVPTQPTTPAPGTPDADAAARPSEEPTAIDLSFETDASATPIAGVNKVISDPMAVPAPNGATSQRPDTETVGGEKEKGFETDSTVSALPSDFAGKSPDGAAESSALDSDAIHFVSRLPRRSAPAPSIADLVQRFNDSTKLAPPEPTSTPKMERPRSGGGSRRQSPRPHLVDVSDSDHSPRTRPKLRRGRTEQPVVRAREASRPGLLSDGDRSYAANASRIPSSNRHKSIGEGMSSDYLSVTRPGMGSRNPSYTGRSPSQVDHRSSPKLRHPTPGHAPLSPYPPSEGKPRVGGKGKTPRPPDSDRHSPSVGRTRRGGQPGSSRVTSMARHFDRLSREAERERQKRISIVRGKRARPVSVTKAKVQVFDNLRDAFRDEFDSDSSEADNEEDDLGSDDSIGSAGRPDKERRKSSPVKSRKSISPKKDLPSPLPHPPSTSETLPASVSKAVDLVESAPAEGSSKQEQAAAISSSIRTLSVLSDTKSEISFTDRLKIELPSFETSAPLPSHPATPHVSTDATTADEAIGTFSTSQASDVEIGAANEKSSLLKSLSGLWAFRAADLTPLEYPLSASEHIFADSRVIIRETEPTSIIAFTLSSKTYRDNSKSWSSNKTEGHFESFMPEETSRTDRAAAWDVVSLDEVDDSTRRERGTHLKYDFESGTSTIFCRIFFAEQFAALRKACNCEDSFVESLARCVQFDASGGKSGSAFLKTKDDRFIAKEITRLEMDALTKFAPAYFDYTRKAFQGQRPTVLAKIYGFFKIGFNNAVTGRTMKMNIYDLKGSTRNRLIQPTGRVNEVLLDENLMEIVYKHPLYLREQAKRILRTALFNDTLFLSNLNVMDYSLVVGVDAEKHELVVGIVDYIRTFTWDKKLESWVKDLGAGGKGEPTIVTPKQYKLRFRTAMERFYFPWVPDRWTVIGSEDEVPLEEENAAAGAALAVAS